MAKVICCSLSSDVKLPWGDEVHQSGRKRGRDIGRQNSTINVSLASLDLIQQQQETMTATSTNRTPRYNF